MGCGVSARGGLRRRLPPEIWADPAGFVRTVLGPVWGVGRDPDGVYVVVTAAGLRVRMEPDLPLRLRRVLNELGRFEGQPVPLQTGSWLRAAARRWYWQDQTRGAAK